MTSEEIFSKNRRIGIFMFTTLQKQAYMWLESLDPFDNKYLNNRLNDSLKANRRLIDQIEKLLKGNLEDMFYENSEPFSKALERIRKSETPEEKQELILLMTEYGNGNVTIIEDSKEETL